MQKVLAAISGLLLILILIACEDARANNAKTFKTSAEVIIFDKPNGTEVDRWPSRTLFTSVSNDSAWVTISGHFPEGEWQPLEPHLFVELTDALIEQFPETNDNAETIFHVPLDKLFGPNRPKAKAYRLLEKAAVFNRRGEIVGQWPVGTNFTSAYENEDAIKITGHFPDGSWQKLEEPIWMIKPVRLQDRTQPKMAPRPDTLRRFVVIDKQNFNLTLFEEDLLTMDVTPLITAPVALGYDRCLPASKGGQCYYTPEGEFEIEFKLFDTDGIKWCVPKKMEAEFADKIKQGERCWRGIMGQHAMHFGNSLFLHGTSNPGSIGSRTTHGCVRLKNSDIAILYKLLSEGDKVIIKQQLHT